MLDSFDAHPSGLGGAVYIGSSPLTVVSSGEDGRISVREADSPSKEFREVNRVDDCAIYCIAAHPKRSQYAIGEKSKQVMVYDFPDGHGVLGARLVLPALALSYNGLGTKLAAAGEDEQIHIINLTTNKDTNVLKTQVIRKIRAGPHTRGLAYDPEGEYLAALSAAGHLQIWETEKGVQKLSRKRIAPDVTGKAATRSGLAWHPDGTDLAVPGLENEVVCYERHNWKASYSLQGGHEAPVSLLCFSPNGLYLATAGQDRKLVIWDLHRKAKVSEQSSSAALVSLDWRPEGNCLLCMTLEGKILLWQGAVPSGNCGPCDDGTTPMPASDSLADNSGRTGSHMDGSVAETGGTDGGGGRQLCLEGFDKIIYGNEEDGDQEPVASTAHESRPPRARSGPGGARRTHMQAPFQSGATLAGETRRRWLAYNLRGGISMREEDKMNILDVSFHDTVAESRRVPPYRDFQALTMAALGDKGAFYARRGGRKEEGLLLWRPFQALFPNSEWNVTLPVEELVEAIAAGRGFVAAATSQQQLRIFTLAGLQIAVNSVPGPVVALAAKGDQLAVVWHGSPAPLPGCQSLMFAVYDANHRLLLQEGALPISQGSTLTWLGFSEQGLLSTYDSKGALRLRIGEWGGSWAPLFSVADHQQGEETYWPVAISKAEMFCIVCKSTAVPSVMPRPVLTRLALQPPLLGSHAPTTALEGNWLRIQTHVSHLRCRLTDEIDAEEMAQIEDEMLIDQTDADKALLRLFQDALKTGRFQRAHELAACMHLQRSLEGALKLTNFHNIPPLAERISRLLANKEAESAQAYEEPSITPLPAPTFTPGSSEPASLERPSPPPRLAEVAITEASGNANEDNAGSETKPISRATGSGSSFMPGGNPFARKGPAPLKPKNSFFDQESYEDGGGKRKADSNPFLRRPKVARVVPTLRR